MTNKNEQIAGIEEMKVTFVKSEEKFLNIWNCLDRITYEGHIKLVNTHKIFHFNTELAKPNNFTRKGYKLAVKKTVEQTIKDSRMAIRNCEDVINRINNEE